MTIEVWFWGAVILAIIFGAGGAILDRRKYVVVKEEAVPWIVVGCAAWPLLVIAGVFWLAWGFGDWVADYKTGRKG